MDESLSKAMDNLKIGFTSLSAPLVKFGLKTVPGLLSNTLKTANSATEKIVDSKKAAFEKVVLGSGTAIGGGGVLASSIIGGKMQVIGSGLGVLGTLIDAASKLSLNITSQVGDVAVVGNAIVANITNDTLVGLADGMKAASTGINIIADSSSNLINAIGNSIFQNVINAQGNLNNIIKTGVTKLQNGAIAISSDSQVTYYNALNSYLKALLSIEKIMNKLSETVNAKGSINPNDAILAAADVTAQLAANDPDAVDNPALTAAADLTAALAATNSEGKTNPALSAAANITAALANLAKNPLETTNPALAAAAKLTASLAATNPQENNDAAVAEDITAALEVADTDKTNEAALLTTADVTEDLATTKPEGSSDPALLAAASISSALAKNDPTDSLTKENNDVADDDTTATLEVVDTDKTNNAAHLTTPDVTEELAPTKPEGASNSPLLAAAGISSALAKLDPLDSS